MGSPRIFQALGGKPYGLGHPERWNPDYLQRSTIAMLSMRGHHCFQDDEDIIWGTNDNCLRMTLSLAVGMSQGCSENS